MTRVFEHYHRTFCESKLAQDYLGRTRGISDPSLWRTFKVGYADGSLLERVPKQGELREQLESLGVLTRDGREFFAGCLVFPIPCPNTGAWVTAYGRALKTKRHLYLKGPLRGILNYQAAKSGAEVILTESVIDALSFHQVGISSAVPLFGASGFTSDHFDALLKGSRRVVLCLDNDEAGSKASDALAEKLQGAGITVRVAALPAGIKDPNELLVTSNGNAASLLEQVVNAAVLRGQPPMAPAATPAAASITTAAANPAPQPAAPQLRGERVRTEDGLIVRFVRRVYHAKAFKLEALDRLRVVLRVETVPAAGVEGAVPRFCMDTVDLYAARSRKEYARRAEARLGFQGPDIIEEELLAVIAHLESLREEKQKENQERPAVPVMTEAEKAEALAFLVRPDLLEQAQRDVDLLGFVGEGKTVSLLYLVAISRKTRCPLSAVILSQSGAGKSGATEVIELLVAPEDVVLFTRLTPQSLYYMTSEALNHKLVIIEERYGSTEADYSIRVLQSRGKLIAAAPVKDPQTGNLRTRTFEVEARCAFIEATTASHMNHENATRCFELSMDESSEQTKRIHERQRLMKTGEGVRLRREAESVKRRHWNAQRLLEPCEVVIPYADHIEFQVTSTRARRDHARFLNLIEASAFLHQFQRQRTEAGEIVAGIEDYAVACSLAAAVLAETLTDLKKPLRDAYMRIRELAAMSGEVSRREIREALEMPDSTVRGWLSELVELEYLMPADGGGKGRTVRYAMSEKGPREAAALGLLSSEELRRKVERG
jgi:DNA primase